eukprot:UN07219
MSASLQIYFTKAIKSLSVRTIYLSSIQRCSFGTPSDKHQDKDETESTNDEKLSDDKIAKENENQPKDPKKRKDPKDIKEIGGPQGPEPTRYGDWEKGGRVSDF